VNQMDVEVRNIPVGVFDFWSSRGFVQGQQLVPDVPVFQDPVGAVVVLVVIVIVIGVFVFVDIVVKLAAFSQHLVEEIDPGLARFDRLVVIGIDGRYLLFGFEAPVGHQTGTNVLVTEGTRIDSHNEFFQHRRLQARHKVHIVGGNRC